MDDAGDPASGSGARLRLAAAALALLIVPALVLAAGLHAGRVLEPRWAAAGYDPDYVYLLNSLNVAEGHAPRHIDHPGTPVQVFGGAVLLVRHWITGGNLRESLLRDPESAAAAISGALQAFHAAALVAFGFAALALTRSIWCAIAAQVLSVASLTALGGICRLAPEPFVMTMSLLLAGATLMALARPGRPRPRFAAVSGLLAGIGMAAKITFAPAGVAALWGVRGGRRWLAFVGAGAAALVVSLMPIAAQARVAARWFWRLLIGSGRYGTVREGHLVIDPARYPDDLWRLARDQPVAMSVIVASVILVVYALRKRSSMDEQAKKAHWALVLVTTAQAVQFLLVAKHPRDRYMLPALSLLGLNACAGWVVLRAVCTMLVARALATVVGVALLLAAVVTANEGRDLLRRQRYFISAVVAEHVSAIKESERTGSVLVYLYGCSSPAFGLRFADDRAGGRYSDDLARLYPGTAIYGAVRDQYQIDGRPMGQDEVVALLRAGRLLFQGPRNSLPPDVELVPINSGVSEGLWRGRVAAGG